MSDAYVIPKHDIFLDDVIQIILNYFAVVQRAGIEDVPK